jgi:hypothetical protein
MYTKERLGVRIGRGHIGTELLLRLPKEWADELAVMADELNTPRTHLIREAVWEKYGDRLPAAYYGQAKNGEPPKKRKNPKSDAAKASSKP